MPRGINSLKCAHHDAYRLFPLQTWKDVVFVDSRPSPFPLSATVYVLFLYPSYSVQLFHFHLSRPFPSPPFARFSTTRCRRGRMAACQLQLAIAAAYLGPDREEKKKREEGREVRGEELGAQVQFEERRGTGMKFESWERRRFRRFRIAKQIFVFARLII